MSGESSEQSKKRGRPSHSPTDNRKTNKRITDKKARQEIRDIVVELTKAGPTLKQLLEAFRSINGDDLLQTVSYILDAIERWKGVQWQQNEEGNSMPCIQEIKDAISEAVSKEVSPLRNDLQNVMLPSFGGGKNGFLMTSQTPGSQCYQNFVQSADFPEQPNNQFENDLISSWPNPSILDGVLEEPWTNTMWPTSTCDENGEKFDDEQVKIFLEGFDGNTKRRVQYSDFNGLQEELDKFVVHNCFPSFLHPIIQKIKDAQKRANLAAVQLFLRLSCSIPQ
ncbi:uncharacterized protein [Gossypium hirsutum]|uniref:Uncharacterized protein n=1 Tax=Gossypium hirsutum TaxID=3635 RepID=A0A1U8KV36_GOSHI|nr:uncharacterized protein LOC107919736 [Gossypium hirsutum]XP_040930755.1 uncharacterized protein LOC107919736 [Gossypium hirsutum]